LKFKFLKLAFSSLLPQIVYGRDSLLHLAGTGYLWKLLGEEIFFTRPERYSGFISAGKTAIAVEFDLVEPFLASGSF